MINADNKFCLIKNALDGKRYALYRDGDLIRILYAEGLVSGMGIGEVALIDNNVITASLLLSGWNQEITADETLTGVAPLVVHFDGAETVHSSVDGFLDLFYHWDFGYTSTASQSVWGTTALLKGQQIGGPIAAHCFEKAGTYPCSVRIQDAFGAYADRYFTVIVRSADDYYSAGNTICISKAGDFTGAPSGATTTTTPPTTVTSNTRYLYRAGEDYSTSTLSIAHSKSKVIIGSFGSGSKPKVWHKLVQTPPKTTDTLLNSVTFMDLNVNDMDIPFGDYISFIRCDSFDQGASDPYVAGCGETVTYYYNNPPASTNLSDIKWPKNSAWVSNTIDGNLVTGNAVGIRGNRPILLGNDIKDPAEHDVRVFLAYKLFMSHNLLGTIQNNTKMHLKFHAKGTGTFTEDYGSSPNPGSKYSVVSDNYNSEDSANWIMALAPQNNSSTELVSYIIMERNQFLYASGDTAVKAFHILSGQNLCVRDYTLSGTVTARRAVGFDAFSQPIGTGALSPYFVPAGNPYIDGSRIFTATGAVTPSKAGT